MGKRKSKSKLGNLGVAATNRGDQNIWKELPVRNKLENSKVCKKCWSCEHETYYDTVFGHAQNAPAVFCRG